MFSPAGHRGTPLTLDDERHPGHPYRHEIAELEHRLDLVHPLWRQKKPFRRAPPPQKAEIKYCLKRRDLLLKGRDWQVKILVHSARRLVAIADDPRLRRNDRGKGVAGVVGDVQAEVIFGTFSRRLDVPVDGVKAALYHMPDGTTDVDEWIRAYHKRGGPPA